MKNAGEAGQGRGQGKAGPEVVWPQTNTQPARRYVDEKKKGGQEYGRAAQVQASPQRPEAGRLRD